MLLRYAVKNFWSIRTRSELNLVAAAGIKDKGCDLLVWKAGKAEILPVVMIYGANASGKTSLYRAMGILKQHITNSFTRRQATEGIDRSFFALDPACANEPTEVDCDIVVDDVRYTYGFAFDDEHYLREWLYSYPEGYKRVLFERDGNDLSFGKSLRGQNVKLSELMRPNALFLSVAAQGAHPQLTPVYDFFARGLFGMTARSDDSLTQTRIGLEPDSRLLELLRCADVGITDIRIERQGTEQAPGATDDAERDDEESDKRSRGTIKFRVQFGHMSPSGDTVFLNFGKESQGTRRLAGILTQVLIALDRGGVLFIDEIDASLHTLLSEKVVDLFSSLDSNPHGAQLIATTHDTRLLTTPRLRRDQIWFAEKSNGGETSVFPLTDIRTRNTDNLEKAYLEGRYGAVPYLNWVSNHKARQQ